MSIKFHIVDAPGSLTRYRRTIEAVSLRSIGAIKDRLSVKPVDVVAAEYAEGAIPHLGVGGYCPSGSLVFVWFNSGFKDFDRTIRGHLPRTLAHELHHAARWQAVGYGQTLLEAVVTEGLASHFEMEVFGGKPQRWDTALELRQVAKFMSVAEKEFHQKDYSHQDWFFGSAKRKIPRWAGYALGYHLVRSYLAKHPKQPASKLVSLPARKILS